MVMRTEHVGGPNPTMREFRFCVQVVSDDIEAVSLIEQVLKSYPSVDREAIGRYVMDRSKNAAPVDVQEVR